MFSWLMKVFTKKNLEAIRGFESMLKYAEDYHSIPTNYVRKWKRSLTGTTFSEGQAHFQIEFGKWVRTIEGDHWSEIRLIKKRQASAEPDKALRG